MSFRKANHIKDCFINTKTANPCPLHGYCAKLSSCHVPFSFPGISVIPRSTAGQSIITSELILKNYSACCQSRFWQDCVSEKMKNAVLATNYNAKKQPVLPQSLSVSYHICVVFWPRMWRQLTMATLQPKASAK